MTLSRPDLHLVAVAGRPLTLTHSLPRDLKHYRAPRPAHRVLHLVHALRMAATLALTLALITLMVSALFSLD